ncbi:hypothetical protein GIB67_009221 [Kingdonia uniflora]|uniref:Uncharacterized protein n=1 Tax=Kingdonia uniflora TaxID=39325 RepID=A0A7J7N2Q0_9MAGN|nr:hypothetical protein GIB67_009221 [Kingdonia uniflora]
MYLGVWMTCILNLILLELLVLYIFDCSPCMAWTIVNLCPFVVTYHFLSWKKRTPFGEDHGIHNRLTWLE